MKTIEMPKLGDTMEEGKILRWIKKEGDPVNKGESLAEVETEKVNIEIEAFASGILRKILVPAGTSAPVGASIAFIGTADEPLPGSSNGTPKTATIAEMESYETTGEAPAQPPFSDINSVGGRFIESPRFIAPQPTSSSTTTGDKQRIFISPIARRIATDHGLDYTRIAGTGPRGRIIKMDIEAALTQQQQQPVIAPQEAIPSGIPAIPAQPISSPPTEPSTREEPILAAIDTGGEIVEIPLTTMRRTIARRLSQSMQTAPHFYVTTVIDTTKLAALRKQINEYAATDLSPIKVSFNDLIIKAVARSLVRLPQVNVSFTEDKLIQKKQVHLGVAVSLEQGLIVPVLRNADRLGILDIARETQRLAEAARTGKLRPEEFSGGTFTISNLGMFDVESFTAVINPPESAILAIGSITPTPVVVDGQIVIRDRMKVTLSSDHRAIDGATAARFLQEIKRLLEEPFGLLL